MARSSYPQSQPGQINKDWLQILPDPQQRKQIALIMAETIKVANDLGSGCWMISHNPNELYLNINVGRIFVLTVYKGKVSILLDSENLPDGAIPDHWEGHTENQAFKVVPSAIFRTAPISEVLEQWDMLKESYYSAVKKASATGKRPPWWKSHVYEAVVLLSKESGIDLPHPDYAQDEIADEVIDETDMLNLIEEFIQSFPTSDQGQNHRIKILESRKAFHKNLANIKERRNAGEDITDDVLLKLLPHFDSDFNISRGAWTTIAPVITKDLKQWFEGAEWTKEENWPNIAKCILKFFETCEDDPAKLPEACQSFNDNVPSKGFQAAILSGGLAALNPNEFAIVNKKPLLTLGFFTEGKYSSNLLDYPETNQRIHELAEVASDLLVGVPGTEGLHLTDTFDMFTHWLIAIRKYQPGHVQYWKVAPGQQGWNWDTCREKNIITIGWDDFGDISDLNRGEFDKLANKLNSERDDYKLGGTKQVWTLAHDIHPGDRIVANQGIKTILGIGTVTGKYTFVPDEIHGHHLPVEWDHTKSFEIESELGWRSTVITVKEKKFMEYIKMSQKGDLNGGKDKDPSSPKTAWVFQANPKKFNLERELQINGNEALTSWRTTRFRNEMKNGDVAILWQAGKKAGIYGFAEITGEAFIASESDYLDNDYMNEGDWLTPIRITEVLDEPILKSQLVENEILKDMHVIRAAQGTNFKVTEQELQALEALRKTPSPLNDVVTLPSISKITGFKTEELECWVRAIKRKGQGILYGPPGTGKTFIAEHLANHFIGGSDGFHDLIQFHPAYSYEDFIQGLRPEAAANGTLDYRLVPGRFMEFCSKAGKRKGPCVLILDEINRANLARVFGELMYLLEYRDREIPLAGGEILQVPSNVILIGTMNTADRSIALVDHALRRRFAFISLRPQYHVMENFHKNNGFDAAKLSDVLQRLNRTIDDPNYEVGISFFMKKDLKKHIEDIWRMEIEPYLEEYFFDQANKVKEFRWDNVRKEFE